MLSKRQRIVIVSITILLVISALSVFGVLYGSIFVSQENLRTGHLTLTSVYSSPPHGIASPFSEVSFYSASERTISTLEFQFSYLPFFGVGVPPNFTGTLAMNLQLGGAKGEWLQSISILYTCKSPVSDNTGCPQMLYDSSPTAAAPATVIPLEGSNSVQIIPSLVNGYYNGGGVLLPFLFISNIGDSPPFDYVFTLNVQTQLYNTNQSSIAFFQPKHTYFANVTVTCSVSANGTVTLQE
jgi:hypothetical protein